MDDVYVYIDGYNFYRGIDHPGWLKYGWCNFLELAKCLSGGVFGLSSPVREVKYYTAPVRMGQEARPGERERQQVWLEAIRIATPAVRVIPVGFRRSVIYRVAKRRPTLTSPSTCSGTSPSLGGRSLSAPTAISFQQSVPFGGLRGRSWFSCHLTRTATNHLRTVSFALSG